MSEIVLASTYFMDCCITCGCYFAYPEELNARLRVTGKNYYCPNGHAQCYTETHVQRLQKQLDNANSMAARNAAIAIQAKADVRTHLLAKQRLQKRLSAGVCPCCNRTFSDLARHMGTKHKGYGLPPAKPQKQLTGAVQ